MDVFTLRDKLIHDYAQFASSFVHIADEAIKQYVDASLAEGVFWPDALIQLNPHFARGDTIDTLVERGTLHLECERIFRAGKSAQSVGYPLQLYQHQQDAIEVALGGHNYVLTTGTGSGKSLTYIIPIVNYALNNPGKGIKAIIIYPMNALANSQYGELEKFLTHGYEQPPVTFARYTGQESEAQREAIIANPPDILLTNYVMMELLLTRPRERDLISAAQGLQFLVLDELHTYRGRQGADVAMLVRRIRERMSAPHMQTVGTSATLSTEGTFVDQRQQIAEVATTLFGAPVFADHVIGETLQRGTASYTPAQDRATLVDAVAQGGDITPPSSYEAFTASPLSSWVETTFGIRWNEVDERYERAVPLSIEQAAIILSEETGVDPARCEAALRTWLLAGYQTAPDPETGQRPFAFRLHQFISPADTVYASLEDESSRYITVHGQRYVPGSNREKLLLPLVFCRECGQEYYSVYYDAEILDGPRITPREYRNAVDDELGVAGYLYLNTDMPWPGERDKVEQRIPEEWLEDHKGGYRIKSSRRKYLPERLPLTPDGRPDAVEYTVAFIQTPFMFCPTCGVSYNPYQRSDYGKLASLSSEGRSSATTIMSLSAIQSLREEHTLPHEARKLLSFTDNRQDAALQAGHFNDFVEVGLLRGALYRAAREAGADGLRHDELTERVAEALDLPFDLYADDPGVKYQLRDDTTNALQEVLGYRLYVDLKRGWRITSPNLEQTGLLKIDYVSLPELCSTDDDWQGTHEALAAASPETRIQLATVLLDYMRRELAIRVSYLNKRDQERLRQRSRDRLRGPWALDEDSPLVYATILFPRAQQSGDRGNNVYLSARGGFGLYVRRMTTLPHLDYKPDLEATETIIRDLLATLRLAGLVTEVTDDEIPGYQIPAGAMRWKAGDGTQAFHDVIRVPSAPEEGFRPNPYFVSFYRSVSDGLETIQAHEHTAQVRNEDRLRREQQFREGELPILYCSPTMELGVDIAELNVVNMRNVPPTPANYAQRSGRAGRGGQPALVFTYCSSGSPHDQYFFGQPERMVAGQVAAPRLDLGNEDLIRAHVQAMWLAETGINLGNNLTDVVNMEAPDMALPLQASLREQASRPSVFSTSIERVSRVLDTLDLQAVDWYDGESWLERVLQQAVTRLDDACQRWRELYRSAQQQSEEQGRIVRDHSRSSQDTAQAKRLRAAAESQLQLLKGGERGAYSDFYSYRYFATEGFLPGYSFPRLPISAYIPGRRSQDDDFISRPRFLAISEFGPRAIIYHEGSRYLINRVILPVDREQYFDIAVKQCATCGFVNDPQHDVCEQCEAPLDMALDGLFRMQNVVTVRRDRINSDEEERLRLGYDIQTGITYGARQARHADILIDGHRWGTLTYVSAATVWRINLGWSRRADKAKTGFVLDTERGYWQRSQHELDEHEDPLSPSTKRVIPFVEDTRNCLLIDIENPLDMAQMASLQAALKRAIETVFQLETHELAAEPLPNRDERLRLLFYEAAEGGAGVLRRLQAEPDMWGAVVTEAMRLCHYDAAGHDLGKAEHASERCEAACYDCLLSYGNQREHALLDRHLAVDVLWTLRDAAVQVSSSELTYEEHRDMLLARCDSDLEREWLHYLYERGYYLPETAQETFERCQSRVDFVYHDQYAVIFIDGPHHNHPDQQAIDEAQAECFQNLGYSVVRFGYKDDWEAIIDAHSWVFKE